MRPLLAPEAEVPHTNQLVGRSEATAPRSDLVRPEERRGADEGLSPEGNRHDVLTTAQSEEAKSLGNVLVELETMKRDRPEDYVKLRQLLDSTRDTIPAQYQQTFQDQLLAIAADQSYSPSLQTPALQTPALQTPPTSVPAPPGLQAPNLGVAPAHYTSPAQTPSSRSPELPSTRVATHIGDAAPPNAAADVSVSAAVAVAEQTPYRAGQWRDEIARAIEALESELIRGKHDREAKARLESYRRLLHVVSNHAEDAVVPIKEYDEEEQEFWKHQLHGLLIALDADRNHAASRRAALALRDLRTASHHLANISALDLRNATFCTKVKSYGEFTEFESYSFRPDEEVILYIEIDNFAAHPKGDRYETELHGSYQVVDDSGRRVANVVLPVDQQVSNNRRRDYFIPYLIKMPAKIAPGSYRLQLAIEDVIGRKSNHASIDFRIR